MKAHQFLFEKGYTQKVQYPDGKEEGSTFNYDTVIRLMTEYVEYLANDESKQPSNCNLPDVMHSLQPADDNTYMQIIGYGLQWGDRNPLGWETGQDVVDYAKKKHQLFKINGA